MKLIWRLSFVIPMLILFGFTVSSHAGGGKCDAAWQERTDYLKKTYGNKFTKENSYHLVYLLSQCCSENFGNCRVEYGRNDDEVKAYMDKYDRLTKAGYTSRDALGHRYYLQAKLFLKAWNEVPKLRKLIFPEFQVYVDKLQEAVNKGLMDNQARNSGSVWVYDEEGAIKLYIPLNSKHAINYCFLLPIDDAKKFGAILETYWEKYQK